MDPTLPLAPLFLARLPATLADNLRGGSLDLESLLTELWARGRAAWPRLMLPAERFTEHLANQLAIGQLGEVQGKREATATLSSLFIEDLYLACACLCGITGALGCIEQRYIPELASFLQRTDAGRDRVDEVLQLLRERLFVSHDGAQPKIGQYSGWGSLMSWLRSAAVHTARSEQRRRTEAPLGGDDDHALQVQAVVQDPELDFIKAVSRPQFRAAFGDALKVLTPEQRDIIRMHYVDGLSIDRIGVLLGIHRATVARWRTEAREKIQKEIRRLLGERLRLSKEEVDSLAGLVQSQLEVSLGGLLRSQGK